MLKTPTHSLIHISSKTAFYLSLIAFVGVFALYISLVNKTVMNVVAREHARQEIASISTSIGSLEYKYLTLKNSVTIDLAYQKGFQDASPSSFLAREKVLPTLSYNYSH